MTTSTCPGHVTIFFLSPSTTTTIFIHTIATKYNHIIIHKIYIYPNPHEQSFENGKYEYEEYLSRNDRNI